MTPKGRTYGCMELVLHPDIVSGKRPPSGFSQGFHYETAVDYIPLGRQIISVLNSAWVLDSDTRFSYPGGGYWLVGASWDEVTAIALDTTGPSSSPFRKLYICHKPFGFVSASKIDRNAGGVEAQPAGDMMLKNAQQMWRGQPSRTISIVRPPYTRLREGRRERGWVRLGDLADASGAYNHDQLVELVLGYWSFGGHEQYRRGLPIGQQVDFIVDDHPDLRANDPSVLPLSRDDFLQYAYADTSDMWLRRGFAFTILRLQALGVRPEILQPA